jgi:alpha-galactosidase
LYSFRRQIRIDDAGEQLQGDIPAGCQRKVRRFSMNTSGMSRRGFVQSSLAALAAIKATSRALNAEPLLASSFGFGDTPSGGRISAEDGPEKTVFTNGIVLVDCDKKTGLMNVSWGGVQKIKDAFSSVKLSDIVKTSDYTRHRYAGSPDPTQDNIGRGLRFTMIHEADGQPDLLQHFSFYEGSPFFLVQAEVRSSQKLRTNYIAAIAAESPSCVDVGRSGQNRALFVPFDNDVWIRYESIDISGRAEGVSSEVTAIYENDSRNGLIFGSVMHDTWKTGVKFTGANGKLNALSVYGGMALETYDAPSGAVRQMGGLATITRDSLPHGEVSGTSVSSPAMFVGFYEDWRDGLEEFGRANAAITPPLVWRQPIPFGWMSYAAVAGRLDYTTFLGAADYISKNLAPHGFQSGNILYHNFDGGWERIDAAQLRDINAYLDGLGQSNGVEFRRGIYMAPFGTFSVRRRPGQGIQDSHDHLDDFVEGTDLKYKYRDIVLKKPNGDPVTALDGLHPLDVTHPGTKAHIATYIAMFKALGYKSLKIDFLEHGAVEGVHWGKSVETGMQAYNQGMKFIRDQVGNDMFLSLSLAPIFPGGYGHARRISCDTMSHISLPPNDFPQQTTEYMLNSLTYGCWTSPSIYIADPDQIPLGKGAAIHGAQNLAEARSRFLSAIISGGMILDSSDFFNDPQARELAPQVYTNPRINALAGGKPFRPIEGIIGDRAADAFVREEGGSCYLAIFNFDPDSGGTKQIPFSRISKALTGKSSVKVIDVWNDTPLSNSGDVLTISLEPAESKLIKLVG